MSLPPGAWQGALIALVGGVIQALSREHPLNVIQLVSGAVFGALIGMGVAKLWKMRSR